MCFFLALEAVCVCVCVCVSLLVFGLHCYGTVQLESRSRSCSRFKPLLGIWIRIIGKPGPDPHQNEKLDPDPDLDMPKSEKQDP